MSATAEIKASKDQHEEIYQVVHKIAGRIRIRIPRLAVDPAYAVKLQQLVESINSVTSVRLNPLASSIIVHYRASAVSNAIQEHLFACTQQAGNVGESTEFTPPAKPAFKPEDNQVILADLNNSHASLGEKTPEEDLVSQLEPLPLAAAIEPITPVTTAVAEPVSLPETLLLSLDEAVPLTAVPEEQISEEILALAISTEATPSSVKLHLNQNELAKRLGVTNQALTRQRTKPKFNEWSRARDPEGRAWIYASVTKSYHTDERKAKQSNATSSDKNGVVREDIPPVGMEESVSLPESPLTAEENTPLAAVLEESVSLPETLLSDNFVDAAPDAVNEEQVIPDTERSTALTEVTPSAVKTEPSPIKLRLSQNDLAERLGVATQSLTHQRTKPKFNEWSKARDPEGRAWIYASATKSYHTDERKARKTQQSDAASSDKNGKAGE